MKWLSAGWSKIIERLFGFDYFISYSWDGSGKYATFLATELKRRKLTCFLDRNPDGFAPGGEVAVETRRAVRASSCLVVVVEPNIFSSKFVPNEVDLFLSKGRSIIPIDLDNTLSRARADSEYAAKIAATERAEHMLSSLLTKISIREPITTREQPSPAVVNQLADSFKHTRRMVLRARILGGAACLFGLVAALATIAFVGENVAKKVALSRQLAAQSEIIYADRNQAPDLPTLLSVEAVEHSDTLEARGSIQKGVRVLADPLCDLHTDAVCEAAAFTALGSVCLMLTDGTLLQWDSAVTQKAAVRTRLPNLELGKNSADAQPEHSVVFSPDSRYVTTYSGDHVIQVYSLEERREIAGVHIRVDNNLPGMNKFIPVAVAFDPKVKYLAAACDDLYLHIWKLDNPNSEMVYESPGGRVTSIAFSPDGGYLAEGSALVGSGLVVIRKMPEGKIIETIKTQPYSGADYVTCLCFSPDGLFLAVGSSGGAIDLYDAKTWAHVDPVPFWPSLSGLVHFGKSFSDAGHNWMPFRMLHGNASISAMRFSPDGRYLLTGGRDGTVRLWNPFTGEHVATACHSKGISTVEFAPDGGSFLSASADCTVSRWAMPRFMQLSYSDFAAFSSGGEYLLSSHVSVLGAKGYDTLLLSDAKTGKVAVQISASPSVAFNRDLSVCAQVNDSKVTVKLVGSERQIAEITPQNPVAIALSPDADKLLIANFYGGVEVLTMPDLRELFQVHLADEHPNTASFSCDGTLCAVGSGRTTHIYQTSSGEEIASIVDSGPVRALAFAPTSGFLATGGPGEIIIWDAAFRHRVMTIRTMDAVQALAFASNGGCLFSLSASGLVQVWSTSTWQEVCRVFSSKEGNAGAKRTFKTIIKSEHVGFSEAPLYQCAWSADGRLRATSVAEARVHLQGVGDSTVNRVFEVGHRYVKGLVFSPHSGFLGVWTSDVAVVLRLIDGKEILRWSSWYDPKEIVFGTDEKHVCMADSLRRARVWDLDDQKELTVDAREKDLQRRFGLTSPILSRGMARLSLRDLDTRREIGALTLAEFRNCCMNSDGSLAAIAGSGGDIQIFESTTGRRIFRTDRATTPMVFSRDGELFAVAGPDNKINIFQVANGTELKSSISLEAEAGALAFSPDGSYIAVGTASGMQIWDVTSGREFSRIPFTGVVSGICFSADQQMIVTVGMPGPARVWYWRTADLLSQAATKVTRNLTPEEWKKYLGDEPYRKTLKSIRE